MFLESLHYYPLVGLDKAHLPATINLSLKDFTFDDTPRPLNDFQWKGEIIFLLKLYNYSYSWWPDKLQHHIFETSSGEITVIENIKGHKINNSTWK